MKQKGVIIGGVAAGIAALVLAGWMLFGRPAWTRHTCIQKARAAAVAEGVDPRLLAKANYSKGHVTLDHVEKDSHIVEFSSDLAGLVYMVYLDAKDGELWWLDELSGDGEYCVVTNLFREQAAPLM